MASHGLWMCLVASWPQGWGGTYIKATLLVQSFHAKHIRITLCNPIVTELCLSQPPRTLVHPHDARSLPPVHPTILLSSPLQHAYAYVGQVHTIRLLSVTGSCDELRNSEKPGPPA
ncbi:hypothetical protein B0J11DRAFT_113818 [Dendryphion nanum]|uniref:Secreted protein n=1 Tax=Dendryphion nanum TaxID=256645 RepID=A0A9P9DB68_9PLEO|nr:hypothetical protein B0J11DRAFT_113818 [Dendryphion nanum]